MGALRGVASFVMRLIPIYATTAIQDTFCRATTATSANPTWRGASSALPTPSAPPASPATSSIPQIYASSASSLWRAAVCVAIMQATFSAISANPPTTSTPTITARAASMAYWAVPTASIAHSVPSVPQATT